MWEALDHICDQEGKTINDICTVVARAQREGGFTSALRVFILNYYRKPAPGAEGS
jgi:predicted DNA-binding ribbon-helix-helix protein